MIFLTSPNRVTSYHIDRECNFLMQVSDEKTINVFDRNDHEVVPDEELENFWSKDNNAGIYKPHFSGPGIGVYHAAAWDGPTHPGKLSALAEEWEQYFRFPGRKLPIRRHAAKESIPGELLPAKIRIEADTTRPVAPARYHEGFDSGCRARGETADQARLNFRRRACPQSAGTK